MNNTPPPPLPDAPPPPPEVVANMLVESNQREAQIMYEVTAVEAQMKENSDRLKVITNLVQQIQQELEQVANNPGANPPGQAGPPFQSAKA